MWTFLKRNKMGFTLIELLVVIAIIGLFTSIILVSLSEARNKAKDTRILTDINQIRTLAQMIYNSNTPNSYYIDATHGICPLSGAASSLNVNDVTAGTQLSTLASDVDTQNGAAGGVPTCWTSDTNYCVSAQYTGGGFICIGDAGKVQNIACTSATACN